MYYFVVDWLKTPYDLCIQLIFLSWGCVYLHCSWNLLVDDVGMLLCGHAC